MSITTWSIVRFLHIVAATMWVGGQLMLSGVVIPAARAQLDPAQRGPLIHTVARRYALVTNVVVLPLALATGLALTYHHGVDRGFFTVDSYTRLYTIKLSLVLVSVVIAILHGILATRQPKTARPMAIAGLAASLGIVLFATALVP